MALPSAAATSDSKGYYNNAYISSDKCLLSEPLDIFYSHLEQAVCSPSMARDSHLDKNAWQTLRASVRVLPIILPTMMGITLSQLLCKKMPLRSTRRFLMEFLLIAMPTVCSNTVSSDYNELYCASAAALIVILLWRSGIWAQALAAASNRCYVVGERPALISVFRCTAYVCTSLAILAVDFAAFPIEYRKSRGFGASLMDVGIGMFVMSMGVVSHRVRHFGDLKRLPKVVVPLLLLGLARTAVITQIDYHQDEHEYGKHLNAFFTLGFTKLFGSLCSILARTNEQLLPLSMAILALHQLVLELGLSDFVLSDTSRDGFWRANREGLSALPGCIALYLLTMWAGKWYMSKDNLNYDQFFSKLRRILFAALISWTLVFASGAVFGIARVTCNAGYTFWMLSISLTMMVLYSFMFEFCQMADPQLCDDNVATLPMSDSLPTKPTKPTLLPAFVEAVNINGLTYFMLSNFLTGFVNLALQPAERSNAESVVILMVYMLASTGAVYVLFRLGIRIA